MAYGSLPQPFGSSNGALPAPPTLNGTPCLHHAANPQPSLPPSQIRLRLESRKQESGKNAVKIDVDVRSQRRCCAARQRHIAGSALVWWWHATAAPFATVLTAFPCRLLQKQLKLRATWMVTSTGHDPEPVRGAARSARSAAACERHAVTAPAANHNAWLGDPMHPQATHPFHRIGHLRPSGCCMPRRLPMESRQRSGTAS
jgi:hypothetical protein